jgi:hypothetical protein
VTWIRCVLICGSGSNIVRTALSDDQADAKLTYSFVGKTASNFDSHMLFAFAATHAHS